MRSAAGKWPFIVVAEREKRGTPARATSRGVDMKSRLTVILSTVAMVLAAYVVGLAGASSASASGSSRGVGTATASTSLDGATADGATSSTSAAYNCPAWSPPSSPIYTNGSSSSKRWGWAYTVHSQACNHWGSAALHEALPNGYQVNVTLTRYNDGSVTDHRYCYIHAGDPANCHTVAILTTSCQWRYETTAAIYRWNGTTWVKVAWSVGSYPTGSCIM
jgi:hypothetical protein